MGPVIPANRRARAPGVLVWIAGLWACASPGLAAPAPAAPAPSRVETLAFLALLAPRGFGPDAQVLAGFTDGRIAILVLK